MKLEKKIVIEEDDISELHAEVVELLDFVSTTATRGEPDSFLNEHFPVISRLKRILDGLVMAEQSTRVLEKLDSVLGRAQEQRKSRLKVVRPEADT